MNSKDFAIGILSTTATILLVGIIVVQTRPEPARAAGMTAAGGDYVLTVGRLQRTTEDVLYVIDSVAEKLIVYSFNAARGQVTISDGVDLKQLRKNTASKRP